jgi:hypothetical protein
MRRTSFAHAALICVGLSTAAAATLPSGALANGRPPATTSVKFSPDDPQTIYVPVTFGFLKSDDDGATFRWVCEATVGYSGTFDPDYAVNDVGDVYATTFDGLRVSRDGGCTFGPVSGDLADPTRFASDVEIGPDARVWAATSVGQGPNDVYVAADGETFESVGLFEEKAWWLSVRTTPDDPMRIYISGFLPGPTAEESVAMLRRSLDGGATWEELPTVDFAFRQRRDIYILAVSPVNADVLFARVVGANAPAGDAVYRSGDGGESWTRVLDFSDLIVSFLIRSDGQTVIAATINGCPGDEAPELKGCVQISRDAGLTFQPATQQPRLACLGERSDGTLFGCGDNWEPDNFALGSSDDGETWTKVYRFSETIGPLECPADTAQAECAAVAWPALCETLGICAPVDAGTDGEADGDDDAGDEDGGAGEDEGGGCCKVAGGRVDAGWIPGLALVLFGLGRRARRRRLSLDRGRKRAPRRTAPAPRAGHRRHRGGRAGRGRGGPGQRAPPHQHGGPLRSGGRRDDPHAGDLRAHDLARRRRELPLGLRGGDGLRGHLRPGVRRLSRRDDLPLDPVGHLPGRRERHHRGPPPQPRRRLHLRDRGSGDLGRVPDPVRGRARPGRTALGRHRNQR